MSKIISRRRYFGVFGLVIGTSAIILIFAYFSFYSNMNIGLVGNISIPNIHDLTNHSTGGANSELNLDNNTSSILVAVWIGLMILGSYLLFHIHFKVLPKE